MSTNIKENKNGKELNIGDMVWYYSNGWRTGSVIHIYSSKTITVKDVMGRPHRVKLRNGNWVYY